MSEYDIWRCVECGGDFTEPVTSSDGYMCPLCGSGYVIAESELDGYNELSDDREYMEHDVDYGDEDEDHRYEY